MALKLNRKRLRLIAAAGRHSPFRADWAKAAGIPACQLTKWVYRGRRASPDDPAYELHRELADLVDGLDQSWIPLVEDEILRLGLLPFEEFSVSGTVLDEASAAPLQVKMTLRPPPLQVGLAWLKAKCPEKWGTARTVSKSDVRVRADETAPVLIASPLDGDGAGKRSVSELLNSEFPAKDD